MPGGETMALVHEAGKEIQEYIQRLARSQETDGSWNYCFESGPLTDAFMIMLLRSLDLGNEPLIRELAERLYSLQTATGYWKLYDDEEGNLSATIQSYNALLFSGAFKRQDPKMKKAERFIVEQGGLERAHLITKWMLAVNGQYPWPHHLYIPMTFLLIPSFFPLNFYDFGTVARIHLLPMAIALNKRFMIRSKWTLDLRHLRKKGTLRNSGEERFFKLFAHEWEKLWDLPEYLHALGYQRAEQYMRERVESDGTLLSYASATYFMIYALLALGYEKNSPIIHNAVAGLKSLTCETNGYKHVQNSTSTIWDTALLAYSLQEAGVSPNHRVLKKAASFLLKKQQNKYGDWAVHNPNVLPGGWGFSRINTINPDIDDTSASLRVLTPYTMKSSTYLEAWRKGVNWLLTMQNRDGGWAAFEKNTDNPLLKYLPIDSAEFAAIDPATPDLTGRTLEFLGKYAGLSIKNKAVDRAINWLLHRQWSDGSWYGKWGVCYVYGTWAAVTGLAAVGFPSSHPRIQKAVNWLKSIQRRDGGWGESCRSLEAGRYIPLPFSTPSQTAWAVDALIAAGEAESAEVQRGVQFLLNREQWKGKAKTYPTGVGLPGQFYVYYHSYNDIFPLLTLSHYRKFVTL